MRARRLRNVLVAALLAAGCGGDDAEPDARASERELAVEHIQVGGAPWGVVTSDRAVWVSDSSRAAVLVIDPSTREITDEVLTGAPDARDAGVALAGTRLVVANLGGSVGVLDGPRVAVGPGEPAAVAVAGGWAWVPLHGPDGGLVRFRLDEAAPEPQVLPIPTSGFAVSASSRRVWVTGLDRDVFAFDVTTGDRVLDVALAGSPRGVAVGDRGVWVTLRDLGEVVLLDADTGDIVARVATGGSPWPVAAANGAVWVATLEGRVLRIDEDEARVTANATIPPQARSITVGAGAVWVATQTGTVARIAAA